MRKLVPPLAELKMLREMQIEVNGRTRNLYNALKASEADELNRVQERLLQRVTSQQANIRELLVQLNESLTEMAQQGAPGGGGGGDGGGDDGDGDDGDAEEEGQ